VTVAVAPDIVEELQGHPDPVLIIFKRSVVIVNTSPNRGPGRSEAPAAMKRKRTNDLFNIVRELAGQQGQKII
jgi:hypothetical protein